MFENDANRRLLVVERAAQITLRGPGHKDPVLHVGGLIQTQGPADDGHILLQGPLRDQEPGRISRGKVDQREDDDRDPQKHHETAAIV